MKRRTFLKATAASAAAAWMAGRVRGADDMTTDTGAPRQAGSLPRRAYKPGIALSIIGFGGMLVAWETPAEARRRVEYALGRGVTYFDVAPQYGDAEEKLGPPLEPYRKGVFLACKTEHRDGPGAKADLERSLQRLRTDHFDLYQLHHITDVKDDVDAVFARGGAMEIIDQAKKDGRIRHVGFSAHSVEAATAALARYPFDSILLPINFATFYKGNFGPQVIAQAQQQGVTLLALKALAKQKWSADHPDRKRFPKCWYEPVSDPAQAALALKFTLSQPVAAAIPPGDQKLFELALDLAEKFHPITPEETQRVQQMASGLDPIFQFKAA